VVLAGENPARLGERQGPAFDAFDAKAEALALLARRALRWTICN
jgi:hypothetical protein